jgi:hypothetical protein
LGITLLAAVLSACGGGSDSSASSADANKPGGGADEPGGTGDAPTDDPFSPEGEEVTELWPPLVHSGFDGTNTYKTLVTLFYPEEQNIGTVEWALADPSIGKIEQVGTPTGGYVDATITTAKAGMTKVTVKAGGKTYEADLQVATYTAAQYTLGQQRYMNPANAGANRMACAGCHAQANGVPHTPTEMAFADDQTLVTVITTGAYPPRMIDGKMVPGYTLQGTPHKWDLTADERTGIVAYLRALPPTIYEPEPGMPGTPAN